MRRIALVIALAISSGAFAEDVITRCKTDVTTLTLGTATWDVRRIVQCGDAVADNGLWHLDRLDSIDGKLDGRFTRTRASALVYVVDTGVDSTHDEFAEGNVIGGIDVMRLLTPGSGGCAADDSPTHPCTTPSFAAVSIATHGTGVASVIAGRNVGVAPGASIVAVRIISNDDAKWLEALNAIIKHAWDPSTPQVRTAIISLSDQLAAATKTNAATHALIEQKIRDMVSGVDADGNRDPNGKRFFFSVAAGNAAEPVKTGGDRGQCGPNYEVTLFPASLGKSIEGVVTVGGTTPQNKMWSESCRGEGVELFAPAEHVLVACNTGRDDYRSTLDSGTSWSAPIVSGAAAWLLTTHPELTPPEMEAILESSGSTIDEGGKSVSVISATPRRRALRH